ncbi:acyl-CoA dehydrogenase family protein [Rummeliibacillus suwonensis]|jgi:alkylation response protein AidB-like acyl-CoA dehydrogenase|uniref:acyl-CoA dehydrogenase family protein n=1 Tax=Rummeliibacillus suwonensis TaxID=1306154 RepID=UPI0011B50900|nr:acyl-CoA dehydrogenase family protein [Rummeliibacillus suwonensis]
MSALKNFIQNSEQQHVIDQLNSLKEAIQQRGEYADRENTFPLDNFKDLSSIQYNQLTLPKEYGGKGFGIYDMILFQETLASFDGATALAIGWQLSVVGEIYEKKIWSEEHLKQFAKEIVNDHALVNRAVSEAITGSPTRGGRPGTNAELIDGKWHITGRKSFTTLSYALTHFLTAAWIEEKNTVGFFLIPSHTKGVSIEENWDVLSMRGTASHDLVLDHIVLPKDALVEINDGPRGNNVNGWVLHIPAVYLGIAQAARDYALHFANTYSPNSLPGPIAELPHVQEKIGLIELKLLNARHFLYSVASKFEDPATHATITDELGAAKYIVVNSAIEIVDLAMRIVGAKSLQTSNPLSRYYRDVRAGLHNPPMDDMTIAKLAKRALGEAH